MRYMLLGMSLFALIIPAFAAEHELDNDSGTVSGSGYWTSGKACNTITIPFDCELIAVKFFVNCPGSSGDIGVDVFEDSGTGSKPSNPSVSLIGGPVSWANTGEDETWQEVDISPPVFFASGTIVHPGQEYGLGSNCGIHMDNDLSGTLGCWHWYTSDWDDITSTYGHLMARLIVEDIAGIESASLGSIKASFK